MTIKIYAVQDSVNFTQIILREIVLRREHICPLSNSRESYLSQKHEFLLHRFQDTFQLFPAIRSFQCSLQLLPCVEELGLGGTQLLLRFSRLLLLALQFQLETFQAILERVALLLLLDALYGKAMRCLFVRKLKRRL